MSGADTDIRCPAEGNKSQGNARATGTCARASARTRAGNPAGPSASCAGYTPYTAVGGTWYRRLAGGPMIGHPLK